MSRPMQDLVFLLDVDNTLIDNDRAKNDIQAALLKRLGPDGAARFWALYEEVRKETEVVNYPETLRRFAHTYHDQNIAAQVADLINNWPYKDYLYPDTLPALQYLTTLGEVAILSDGDADYQPRKIASAGLTHAVGGPADVLVFIHKVDKLEDIMERIPGRHYVFVDDKEYLLAGFKETLGDKATTLWVKQGHYAADPTQYKKPDPDLAVDHIGGLCEISKEAFEGNRQ
jgi:FMN phosphatase YigB (HAD superfamily)